MSPGLNTIEAPVLDPLIAQDLLLEIRHAWALLRDSTLPGDALNKKALVGIALADTALELVAERSKR